MGEEGPRASQGIGGVSGATFSLVRITQRHLMSSVVSQGQLQRVATRDIRRFSLRFATSTRAVETTATRSLLVLSSTNHSRTLYWHEIGIRYTITSSGFCA